MLSSQYIFIKCTKLTCVNNLLTEWVPRDRINAPFTIRFARAYLVNRLRIQKRNKLQHDVKLIDLEFSDQSKQMVSIFYCCFFLVIFIIGVLSFPKFQPFSSQMHEMQYTILSPKLSNLLVKSKVKCVS